MTEITVNLKLRAIFDADVKVYPTAPTYLTKEVKMNKRHLMIRSFLIVSLAIFVFISTVQASDPFESTACVSGTMTMLHNSEALMISGFELKGPVRSNTNAEILNNVSEMCVGLFTRMREEITQSGYCKYLYPNGDINTLEWNGDGNGGEWKFLSGTGKWEGIKGGGTYSVIQRVKSIAPGTFQNCRMIKGMYELPK